MSREYLEILGKNIRYKKEHIGNDIYRLYIKKNGMELLENYLTELEQIKNAKLSEALECLEYISKEEIVVRDRSSIYMNPNDNNKGAFTHLTTVGVNFKGALEHIKQALIKAQEMEIENAEYKRVLEIIKYKRVNVYIEIILCDTYYEYLDLDTVKVKSSRWKLNEEEFELLKKKLG